jgi:hypothetical protein
MVISECYVATLKTRKECIMRKAEEIDDDLLHQDNSRTHTSAATTDSIARWGLQCYHIRTTVKIFLLVISTCSTNRRNTTGTKTSVLNKKLRLQCTSIFGESERIF